jgi:hypothetical protein
MAKLAEPGDSRAAWEKAYDAIEHSLRISQALLDEVDLVKRPARHAFLQGEIAAYSTSMTYLSNAHSATPRRMPPYPKATDGQAS